MEDKELTIKIVIKKKYISFLKFIDETGLNFYTLEGMILSGLVYIFPHHAIEIADFFAAYLGVKPNKSTPPK